VLVFNIASILDMPKSNTNDAFKNGEPKESFQQWIPNTRFFQAAYRMAVGQKRWP
jgi:hypothetical protein